MSGVPGQRLTGATRGRMVKVAASSIAAVPDETIAREVGMTPEGVRSMRKHATYREIEAEALEALAERMYRSAFANPIVRVGAIDDMIRRVLAVIEARATDPTTAHIPGASTGLRFHRLRGVGQGENFQVVEEVEVDTALIREFRGLMELMEQQTGQARRVDSGVRGVITFSLDPRLSPAGDIVEAEFAATDGEVSESADQPRIGAGPTGLGDPATWVE
jgi:hypothetical protein